MALHRLHFRVLQASLCAFLLVAAGFEALANYHSHSFFGTHVFRGVSVLLVVSLLLADGITRWRWQNKVFLWGGILAMVGLPLVYGLNASHIWREGVGLVPVEHRDWLPASAYRSGSAAAVWVALAVGGVLGTGARLPSRHRSALLVFCCVFAFGMTLWALSQRLAPRAFAVFEWTGGFVSPNHYAAFCYLVFPVACTLGVAVQRSAQRGGRLSSPAPLFYLLAGLLCWGVMVTGSRAGMGILVLQGLGMLACVACWANKANRDDRNSGVKEDEALDRRSWRRVLSGGGRPLRFVGVLGVAIVVGILFLTMRGGLGRVGTDLLFRGRVVVDTFRMIGARPWWGMGPGSFAAVFPYYQSEALAWQYFQHAHNEPVQFLAEWGLLGAAMMCLGVWSLLGGAGFGKQRFPDVACAPESLAASMLVRAGLLLALAGLALHSLVDFPLRHPLLLLLAAFWFSMLVRSGWQTKDGHGQQAG